ncbi:LamG domain-containing protein [Candidatus Poribacteria bacterium]|nr:LamG domain-containing protein [Candidatus Poribacteria bacterium]
MIGHGFSGIIDEVRIYNKALIDDEIQEILWGNF